MDILLSKVVSTLPSPLSSRQTRISAERRGEVAQTHSEVVRVGLTSGKFPRIHLLKLQKCTDNLVFA